MALFWFLEGSRYPPKLKGDVLERREQLFITSGHWRTPTKP